jgi:hypothetical protein
MFGNKNKPKEPPEETTKKEERKHHLWPDGDMHLESSAFVLPHIRW